MNDIAIGPGGTVWLATGAGLARYDDVAWKTFVPTDSGLLDKAVCNVAIGISGHVWIAYDPYSAVSHREITRFDGVRWEHFRTDGPSSNEVAAAGVDNDNGKCFAAQGGGLSTYDGASWDTVMPTGARETWYFRDFAVDSGGVRWFATEWGVWRFDGTEWRVFSVDNSGLVSNDTYVLAFDGAGVLWCGTREGVCSFDGAVWKKNDDAGSPGGAQVLSIAVDRTGSRWFGTGTGLYRFDGSSWTSFENESTIGTVTIRSIAVDSGNVKWFATDAGLVRFDGNLWVRFTKDTSGLPDNAVRTVVVDKNDAVWLSTGGLYAGVVRFDGVTWRKIDEPSGSGIRDIVVDGRNVKWFVTYWGISSYDDGMTDNPSGVAEIAAIPAKVRVFGNEPNPFNASTVIRFMLPSSCRAELAVYDITGRKVRVFDHGMLPAGEHSLVWNARDADGRPVSSGTYLFRITAGGHSEARKMLLLR